MERLLKKDGGNQEKRKGFLGFKSISDRTKEKFDLFKNVFLTARAKYAYLKLEKIIIKGNPDNYAGAKIAKYYLQAYPSFVNDELLAKTYDYLMKKYGTIQPPSEISSIHKIFAAMQALCWQLSWLLGSMHISIFQA